MVTMDIITCLSSERGNYVPDGGQAIVCTDTGDFYLGDGVTVGGEATNKHAKVLSEGLDELGLFETMESHYVIRDPNLDVEDPRAHYLVTSKNEEPMLARTHEPDNSEGDLGDIAFIY